MFYQDSTLISSRDDMCFVRLHLVFVLLRFFSWCAESVKQVNIARVIYMHSSFGHRNKETRLTAEKRKICTSAVVKCIWLKWHDPTWRWESYEIMSKKTSCWEMCSGNFRVRGKYVHWTLPSAFNRPSDAYFILRKNFSLVTEIKFQRWNSFVTDMLRQYFRNFRHLKDFENASVVRK